MDLFLLQLGHPRLCSLLLSQFRLCMYALNRFQSICQLTNMCGPQLLQMRLACRPVPLVLLGPGQRLPELHRPCPRLSDLRPRRHQHGLPAGLPVLPADAAPLLDAAVEAVPRVVCRERGGGLVREVAVQQLGELGAVAALEAELFVNLNSREVNRRGGRKREREREGTECYS